MLAYQEIGVAARNQRKQHDAICLFIDVQTVAREKYNRYVAMLLYQLNYSCLIFGCNQAATYKKEIDVAGFAYMQQLQAACFIQVIGV